ncbi:Fic family protein [Candidatus Woesearchaeota archaeon]|nr:Fic family protein [Candidatus Woesearchaeota archaeon]
MAYIYKKKAGTKEYYYLRVSKRKGNKIVAKDVAYLGSTLEETRKALDKLPAKTVRTAYRTITKFLESNTFFEHAKKLKLKQTPYLSQDILEHVEACRLHWQKVVQKRDPRTREEQLKNFAIEFAFNTTSIEGNTITIKEAAKLLIEQITPKNRTLREVYDIQNTERVFFRLFENPCELTHDAIMQLHQELMQNIDSRLGYRTGDVRVIHARFKATPAPYVRTDMGLLLKWYNDNRQTLHPFVLASIFHHKFEKIHPFFDGNGRTGRMLMNAILLYAQYPPAIIRKKNRQTYLDALSKADAVRLEEKTLSSYKPLVEFTAIEYTDTYWNNFL